MLSVNESIAYDKYNHINGMGFGLKALQRISKDKILIKMNTSMGFISNELFDDDREKS